MAQMRCIETPAAMRIPELAPGRSLATLLATRTQPPVPLPLLTTQPEPATRPAAILLCSETPGTADVTDGRKFTVEGEKRYWLHIALDRAAGTVLGSQLE